MELYSGQNFQEVIYTNSSRRSHHDSTTSPGILGIFNGEHGKKKKKLKISGVVQMVILNDL